MPLVRPDTAQLSVVVVQVRPPGEEVTVYSVIAAPPFDVGAASETVAEALPATTPVMRGASGAADGVAEAELESAEKPHRFFIRTLNV